MGVTHSCHQPIRAFTHNDAGFQTPVWALATGKYFAVQTNEEERMVQKLGDDLFDVLLTQANDSPRKRSHSNIHKDLDEPVQRLCIGLKKGTYVRPHHHPKKNKWEMMLVLKGSVAVVIFDAEGRVTEKLELSIGGSLRGIENAPNTWHTLFPLTDEAVIMEVKEGPFTPSVASDFATWAPEEGDADVDAFLAWLERATTGEYYQQENALNISD